MRFLLSADGSTNSRQSPSKALEWQRGGTFTGRAGQSVAVRSVESAKGRFYPLVFAQQADVGGSRLRRIRGSWPRAQLLSE